MVRISPSSETDGLLGSELPEVPSLNSRCFSRSRGKQLDVLNCYGAGLFKVNLLTVAGNPGDHASVRKRGNKKNNELNNTGKLA